MKALVVCMSRRVCVELYKALVALRDTLARSIDECDSMRDLAALSRQMTDVLEQIEQIAGNLPE